MWFNVDGELVGNDPATFEVMPGALHTREFTRGPASHGSSARDCAGAFRGQVR